MAKQMKYYLLAPGPTPVHTAALARMAEPIIHHRAPAFQKLLAEVREGLKYLFQTKNEVLILASSGTGAMESSITNFLRRGDKAICVRGGKFGERWTEICAAYGVTPINIDVPWGQAVDPQVIAAELKKDPSIKAVYTQASETSTGVAHPIQAIAAVVKNYENTMLVVDAISALGVAPLPMDEWGIDILLTGSQKALMLPPGLAFIAVSDKAWKLNKTADLPHYYFNLAKELKKIADNQTNFTPAVSLIVGLKEVLGLMKAEGLENIYLRHARMAEAARAAVKAMGLELYAPNAPANGITAIKTPAGVDGQSVVKILRDKHNVTIAGGQDQAKGKIVRIAHMGFMDYLDLITALGALELALQELGYQPPPGQGIAAALAVLGRK